MTGPCAQSSWSLLAFGGLALVASMGPQPWELRKQHKLKETIHVDRQGFNGAAALGAAETLACGVWPSSMSLLQWGRSLGGCGNQRLEQIDREGHSCFNGAAALGAAETQSRLGWLVFLGK